MLLLLTSCASKHSGVVLVLLSSRVVLGCALLFQQPRVPVTVIKPLEPTITESGDLGLTLGTLSAPLQLHGGTISRQYVRFLGHGARGWHPGACVPVGSRAVVCNTSS